MADTTTNVEASLLRYLYENLSVPLGIKVFEDIYTQSFDKYSEWVVIDTLSGTPGVQPKQHFFIHVATQNGAPQSKEKLTRLFGTVLALFSEGTEILLYDYDSDTVLGSMYVLNPSTTPILQHKGGGNMRTISIAVTYQGE